MHKKSQNKFMYMLLFTVIFIIEMKIGFYVCEKQGLIYGDAMARIANAFYVIFTKPRRLASIGLIWNPLPSILEIPLVFIWKTFKLKYDAIMCGVFLTSVFAAGNSVIIFKIYEKYHKNILYPLVISLLYALNPYILLYGANGMSESIYIYMILVGVYNFINWIENDRGPYLYKVAFALAVAFLVRYETVFLSVGFSMAAFIIMWKYKKKVFEGKKEFLDHAFSLEMVLLLPVIYVVILWVVINWVIMGDPFYFTKSTYSNTGQMARVIEIEGGYSKNLLREIQGNPLKVIMVMMDRLKIFIVPFIYVFFRRIYKKEFFKADFCALIILLIFSQITQLILLFQGKSPGWLRFFMYPFPIAVLWLGYELRNSKSKIEKYAFIPIILIISGGLSMYALYDYEHYYDSLDVMSNKKDHVLIETKEIARYINNKKEEIDGKVLLDTFYGYNVLLNIHNTDQFIATNNDFFYDAVKNPTEHDVKYLLVANPKGYGTDAINDEWQGLYEDKLDWCVLEKDFGEYRLFKIKDEKDDKIIKVANIREDQKKVETKIDKEIEEKIEEPSKKTIPKQEKDQLTPKNTIEKEKQIEENKSNKKKPRIAYRRYALKSKETLYSVSQWYYGTGKKVGEIKRLNGIKDDTNVKSGSKIKLMPYKNRAMSRYAPRYYKLKPGETLFSVSMKFYKNQNMVEKIKKLNNIEDVMDVSTDFLLQMP